MYQQPETYRNQGGGRPLGITIIAVLLALGAAFAVLVGLGQIIGGPFLIFSHAGLGGFITKEVDGIVGIVLAVAQLWVAYGLFSLKPWSFWVTVGVELLGLLHGCFGLSGTGLCAGLLPLFILVFCPWLERETGAILHRMVAPRVGQP